MSDWRPDEEVFRGADGDTFADVVRRRLNRRDVLRGGLAASALVLTSASLGTIEHLGAHRAAAASQRDRTGAPPAGTKIGGSRLNFAPIAPDSTDEITLAPGYTYDLLLRWGDPILPGGQAFDWDRVSPAAQLRQFGFNNDYLGYFPLGNWTNSEQGLLFVNHEYTDGAMMFPGYDAKNPTRDQVNVELLAHGASVVEVVRHPSGWEFNPRSPHNRRITAFTPMQFTGPAAGSDWLKTSTDRRGLWVSGMLNNCAGGKTLWGTVLTAEENFNQYFANADELPSDDPRRQVNSRYGIPTGASERLWEKYYPRFDLTRDPNEVNRFGWMVEIDPYDPSLAPRKRTALGRTKHEGGDMALTYDGRVAVYMGDDERFDYWYKFVSDGHFDASNRVANMNLLDSGTLYVAKFNDDGSGTWIPLVFGQGSLTPANGFASQADVLVKTRLAGDAVGATKMDRPEDGGRNPATGGVYLLQTNNTQRGEAGRPGVDTANPRADNRWGHVIEVWEANNDPGASTFAWDIFLLCGDPEDESTYFAGFPKSMVSPIAAPDNLTFDSSGNLWIYTDGQPSALKVNDAIHVVPTQGSERGYLRQFMSAVSASEVCGPEFTPDETTLFAAIQHPGEGGTLAEPTSTWPDRSGPARPAIIAIRKTSGGLIGT